MSADFIRMLHQLDPDLNLDEIRDILWLAMTLEMKKTGLEDHLVLTPESSASLDSSQESLRPDKSHASDKTGRNNTRDEIFAELFQADSDGSATAVGRGQLTFRTPAAVALPDALGLARALRPLRRRVPSRTQVTQDTSATIRRICDEEIWIPVLRPARSRWFDVALVIDESMPMLVWQDTIRELQRLLERHGAFRTVRVWRVRAVSDGSLTLHAGHDPVSRPVHALCDSVKRQLILVASNCLSPAWFDGRLPQVLRTWSQINPVALVQMLPQTLWRRTALRTAPLAQFHAPAAGIPNQKYDWHSPSLDPDINENTDLRLPILTLEPESFRRWARLTTGAGMAWIGGVMLPVKSVPSDGLAVRGSLRSRLSPTAYLLAGYLACAAPLTLPIMRLVQQTMLPTSRQVHLAEVLMSGALQVRSDQEVMNPNSVVYTFAPGSDDALREGVPLTKAGQVLGAISSYIASELGRPNDFESILAASAADGAFARTVGRPFARIAATVLERFGGELALYAVRLRAYSAQEEPDPPASAGANLQEHGAQEEQGQLTSTPQGKTRFHSTYDPALYVHRHPIEDDIIRKMMKIPARPKDERSFIIQASGNSGKTWLLEYIVDYCEKSSLRPIILTVCIDDFTRNYSVAEDLCVPIVQRLWDTVDRMYPHVAPDLRFRGNANEIIPYLGLLGVRLFSQPIQPLVLIFVDGMEEIIEASIEKKNLLSIFENTVIAPLFKHYNVRVLGTHRGRSAHWHTYLLKKSTTVKPLPDFSDQDASNPGSNSPLRQFLLLFDNNPPFQFDMLRQQLPAYDWNHPGINNLLFKYAYLHGPVFTEDILETVLQVMTRSARGLRLDTMYRDWLGQILLHCQPALPAPLTDVVEVELAKVNTWLAIEEGARNAFLDELETRGIGTIKFPYFDIRPGVAAIFFELQRRTVP